MTDTEIRVAGRELDAEVAEKVMGQCAHRHVKTVSHDFPYGDPDTFECLDCGKDSPILPHYSTDIAAAWEIVEKMGQKGQLSLGWGEWGDCAPGIYRMTWWHTKGELPALTTAKTAPLAICLTALKAVTATDSV